MSRPPARGRPPVATTASTTAPERWSADAGGRDVCRLDIPADALRERRFEIACTLVVVHPGAGAARHGLTVLVDGLREWSREVETHDGPADTLDVRFHRTVPPGRALRIVATAEVQRARRLRLAIGAQEE